MHRYQINYFMHISPGLCIGLALLLLLLPLQWMLAVVLAAMFHELCHAGMIRLCGGRILSVRIGVNGAVMETEPMSNRKELLCALAGPVGGLLLILVARWLPRVAVCGVIHSLYNLLPIYPLDGGRALQCGMELLFPPATAKRICDRIGQVLIVCILVMGCYGTFILKLGLVPLIFALVLWQKTGIIKIPCKQRHPSVQ
ncbi:MAG: hypothetical protein IJX67_10055 [Oscillospiraceae bacterium]|nr:hypothetical protein [Oscillospiraceae bacterium]